MNRRMNEDELKATIRSIPDFPKEGILFRDITTLIKDKDAYCALVDDIADVLRPLNVDIVIGPEARGFVIGSAVAYAVGAGFVLARKPGKLPCETVKITYGLEYGSDCLEIHKDAIKPGMRIAIVGPTGCGKTTLINLLMRFYDVDSGTISIDGTPITSVSRHSLRSSFGMVLQETWLKSDTVRENIRFGRPDATDQEVIQAAKSAHCWDFIRRLPKGLDTVLREDSVSQGQKQLLCIARVMLCLPPMLILDEATSSIDTRTEILVQQAFDTLMEGRTSFVVAHRLSTVRNASLILVMRDGKIIEQGTHQELLAAGGFYSELYNSQFQPS